MALLWATEETDGRGGGVVKEGGDSSTSWRFCAQSYSETFEHLFHESAYYVRRRGCRAKEATGGVQRDECPRLSKYMHHQGGVLCVLPASRKGLQETTDFVTPATSDVAANPFNNHADLRLDDNLILLIFLHRPPSSFHTKVSLYHSLLSNNPFPLVLYLSLSC